MPESALLLAASIASLNLCTDEYLLLLARPHEIASVSYLSQDPLESPLWRQARRHHSNRGSIEQVLAKKPDLILTMGGGGRATGLIARRMNIQTIELAPTGSLDDVRANLHAVATALGDPRRAQPWT
ncbi:MAG TPA: ABC transporter substrate-binding protein, partial [Sphingomicrobium sp.]|nr:ABC transporter substrate-binding protein [Sphingomicrobium sp.]